MGLPAEAAGTRRNCRSGHGHCWVRHAVRVDQISDDELAAIEARAVAATAGPWESFVEGRDHMSGDDFIRTGGMSDEAPDMYVSLAFPARPGLLPAAANDLDFIAAARQDIPRLVAEIRRLRGS